MNICKLVKNCVQSICNFSCYHNFSVNIVFSIFICKYIIQILLIRVKIYKIWLLK